ncbi:MAG: hypothetical protein ACJ77E_16275 [Gaiellaceae bacterium]
MTLGNAPDPPGVRAAREQPTIAILPTTYFVNFQLAAGVWILQTLPAVFLGVLLPRLPARAALAGWAVGIAYGTYLLTSVSFDSSSTSFGLGSHHVTLFIGVPALVAKPRGRRTGLAGGAHSR